jgi:hypothetical protein
MNLPGVGASGGSANKPTRLKMMVKSSEKNCPGSQSIRITGPKQGVYSPTVRIAAAGTGATAITMEKETKARIRKLFIITCEIQTRSAFDADLSIRSGLVMPGPCHVLA